MMQTEEYTGQSVQELLDSGDIVGAMIVSARAGKEAARNGTPTDPKVMIDMALVAEATGSHEVAISARAAAFRLRHPARSAS